MNNIGERTIEPATAMTSDAIDTASHYWEWGIELTMLYLPKLLLAIATLVIGLWVIAILRGILKRAFDAKSFDPALEKFLLSVFSVLLKVVLVVSVIQMVGVATTSFIALLGAAGLAIGMALSGTLQNFAGGVMILTLKPFKLGDYIEALGYSSTVDEIQIFNTILKTPDNKTIILPNGGLATGTMINYSTEAERRVDFTFGIGYDDDIDAARKLLQEVVLDDKRVLQDRANQIVVGGLGESSVDFTVRAWVNAADYWGFYFDKTEEVKKAMDKAGITIPYPQQDVHMHTVK